MMLYRLLFVFGLLGISSSLSAQDIHYTLHNMAPLWLNPANTGAFYGSVRASGIYRGQWHGFGGINTPSLSLDAPVIKGLRKQDWIGAGFMLISDNAGSDNEVVTTITGLSASYHLSLDKDQQTVLTLGLQYGSVNFGINPLADCGPQENTIEQELGGMGGSCEMFGQGTGGGTGGGNNNNQDGPRNSYTDINAGLSLRTVLDKKSGNTLEVGLAMLHLNTDDYNSFIMNSSGMPNPTPNPNPIGSNGRDARERKATIHAHANLNYAMTDKLRFMPTVYYQQSVQNSSVSLQAWMGTQLKNEMLFKFGLGYRTGDAGKILVGLEKDRLQVAASYDIPLSDLTPTTNLNTVNSFELAANYIFNIYKKPEVKQNILCPQI